MPVYQPQPTNVIEAPAEVYDFNFSFQNYGPILAGGVISAATVTCPDITLTITSVAFTASGVQARITGATSGVLYKVKITATLANGQVLKGFVNLYISNPPGF